MAIDKLEMVGHAIWVGLLLSVGGFALFGNSTVYSQINKASESEYERDIRKARTSENLSNADLAWHALNTYGWDCGEVTLRGESQGNYYNITCSNGTVLRVYPRANRHPKITNSSGKYE